MKSNKKILFAVIFITIFLCLCALTNNVKAAIKENSSSFSGDTYVIGSTKFNEGFVITASRAAIAGANEAYMRYLQCGGFEFNTSDIKTYYYCEFDGSWSEVNVENGTLTELSETEVEELEENLNIFYVNNEEKTLEIPFEGKVDKGTVEASANGEAKVEDGKIIVPASWAVNGFTFESQGQKVDVTLSDSSSGEELEAPVVKVYDNVAKVNGTYYESLEEAFKNAENLTVTLLKDVDLTTGIVVDTKVTLNLNGHTVTSKNDTEGNGLFTVVAGGDLTIEGEGTLDSACQTNDYSMAVWVKETGKLTINGGTYTNLGAKDFEDNGTTPNNNELIYARDSGTVVINAGTFVGNTENATHGAKYTLNKKDNSAATITVYGGKFTGYNPAVSNSEDPAAKFTAEGYKVVVAENTYKVEKIENTDVAMVNGSAYTTVSEAFENAKNSTVTLLKDVDLPTGVVVDTKVTLNLNGHTVTSKNDTEGNGLFTVVAGGDLTIAGEGTLDSACQTNDYSMAVWVKETGKLTINGGTYTNLGAKDFEDNGTTPNNNELIYARDNGTVVINAGTFVGNTENATHGAKYTLNKKDNSAATITVYGGKFTEYNPAVSNSEDPAAKFTADGYTVNEENGIYTVVKQ